MPITFCMFYEWFDVFIWASNFLGGFYNKKGSYLLLYHLFCDTIRTMRAVTFYVVLFGR